MNKDLNPFLILDLFSSFLNFIYFFIPEGLVLFAFSMAILTITKVLSKRGGKINILIKYCVLLIYAVFSAYQVGLFLLYERIRGGMDIFSAFTLIAPMACMFFVMVWAKRKKLPFTKKKVLNYIVMWVLYLIISIIVWILMPEDILFGWNLVYIVGSFTILMVFTDGGRL